MGAYAYVTGLQSDVEKYRTKYNNEHTALVLNDARHTENANKLQAALDSQNDRIAELNATLIAAEAEIAEATDVAAEVKNEYEIRINGFLTAPKPKTCDKAIDYLVDAVPDLQWSTK